MADVALSVKSNSILADIDLAVQDVVGDKFPFSASTRDFQELLKNINLSMQTIYNVNLFEDIEILEYLLKKYVVKKSAIRIKKNLAIFPDERIPWIDKSEQEKFEEQIVIPDKIKYLLSIPQPEQKSQAWLDQRQNYITASVFGEACGLKGPTTLVTLLLNKISYGKFQPFNGNKATQWGEKYEDIANMIYGYRNCTKVYEFGMISHPELPFLGASTDGISAEMINIEIKCPYSRFITGIPPPAYWAQMQLQMATLDLNKTHFLECSVQEYPSEEAFFDDFEWIEEDQFRIPLKGDQITFKRPPPEGHHAEKGLIIEVIDMRQENLSGEPKTIFIYSPIEYYLNKEKLKLWRDMKIYEITHSKDLIFTRVIPWVLIRLSCVEVERDQGWFDAQIPILKEFWKDVEYYRKQNLNLNEISSLKDELIYKYMNFGEEDSSNYNHKSKRPSPKQSMLKDSLIYNEMKTMGCQLDSDDETADVSVKNKVSQPSSNTNNKLGTSTKSLSNKFSGCVLDSDDENPPNNSNKPNDSNKINNSVKNIPTTTKKQSQSQSKSTCVLSDSDDEIVKPKKQQAPKKPRQTADTVHITVQNKPLPPSNSKTPLQSNICLL